MKRVSLTGNTRDWGAMVIWMKDNYGEAMPWRHKVAEPQDLDNGYRWAMGSHIIAEMTDPVDEEEGFGWPCFWIPDGPIWLAFVLRWAK